MLWFLERKWVYSSFPAVSSKIVILTVVFLKPDKRGENKVLYPAGRQSKHSFLSNAYSSKRRRRMIVTNDAPFSIALMLYLL